METFKDLIKQKFGEIENDLKTILTNYSSIGPRVNDDNPGIFFMSADGDRYWNKLNIEGSPLQSKLYKNFNQLSDLLYVLICKEPHEYVREFEEHKYYPFVGVLLQQTI